jgi:peptide deformylase
MGVGIAAVQVGIPERFAIVFAPTIQKKMLVLINPVITKESLEQNQWPEICMSSHPCIAPVIRPAWVEFDYYDAQGKKQQWTMKADTAAGKRLNRIVQHEIDHLNGIINIDRVAAKDIIFESDPDFYTTASFTEI